MCVCVHPCMCLCACILAHVCVQVCNSGYTNRHDLHTLLALFSVWIIDITSAMHRLQNSTIFYVHTVPPEFKAPERVLYVRAGDRLQLNCTPDAHSSSGGNVPSYDLEDRTGPAAITQLSYRFSKNGSEIMSPSLGSSGLLNVTDVANMTDSGMYSCVVEDAVYRKEARFRFLARRKRGVVQISTFSILEGVTQSLLASPRLSATVSFSVVVGGKR